MKYPVVILHTDQPEIAQNALRSAHSDLTFHTCNSYAGLSAMVKDTKAEVVFSIRFDGTPTFPRQALLDSETVKWVAVGGSGTDHMAPWNPDILTVTNATGISAHVMAQYVLSAMLHFSFNFPEFRAAQDRRDWIAGRVEPINGKTVLIIGLGKTGHAVADISKRMDLNTIGVRSRARPCDGVDEVYEPADLPQLWARADYVVSCVPLTNRTRGLIGSAAFDAMKPGAVLIDVSRGGVVDEGALLAALDTGKIKGAALDVFEQEPLPADNRLWGYPNVIITPHCSSVFADFDRRAAEIFSANLTRYRNGTLLKNIVNPERGY